MWNGNGSSLVISFAFVLGRWMICCHSPLIDTAGCHVIGSISFDVRPLLAFRADLMTQRYVSEILRSMAILFQKAHPSTLFEQNNASQFTPLPARESVL
ncbi:hypothetical protein TNIN_264061 [Trichonephila inaurata madagascariensis]|uniref:Secreted protein n=1 Tax=Trichonephila inaurata madagascariensis TaxID=2747483 RepID=A0A8X6Y023_9ARAC|nr:hypothetical protein TNIN_264061 [Trichonephila inaurata madagascariensis]